MSNFKDKFKDKSEVVQRDGSNAGLVNDKTSNPSNRRQSKKENASDTSSMPRGHGSQMPSANVVQPSYQPQQQPHGGSANTIQANAPPGHRQSTTSNVVGTASMIQPGGSNMLQYAMLNNPHALGGQIAAFTPQQATGAVQMSSHHQAKQKTSLDIAPQAATGVDPQFKNKRAQQRFLEDQAALQRAQLEEENQKAQIDAYHQRKEVGASPNRDESPYRRERRKPALPDFSEIKEEIQHGRRAGKLVITPPPMFLGNYIPHTFKDYKRMQDEFAHQKFGGLGADDNDEKKAARQKRQKIIQYSRSVNAVNFAAMEVAGEDLHGRPIEKKLPLEAQIGLAKRERAVQYAEHVPKPKAKRPQAKTPEDLSTSHHSVQNEHLEEELKRLEDKHRKDQETIVELRGQLHIEKPPHFED